MALKEYWKKRDFRKTPEPAGSTKLKVKKKGLSYLIQKHAASRLHYDFRLEWNGTLKSWAVPKGPSLDPAEKRLAVEVEDHPVEYGTFEGTIPKGQYGGGAVALWDRGTWEPVEDFDEGLRKGRLKFLLHGEKLEGRWALVRMAPRPGDTKPNWLLIKDKDAFMRRKGEIVDERPESVVTGRTVEEIAAEKDGATWQSSKKAKVAKKPNVRLSALAAKVKAKAAAPAPRKKVKLAVPKGARKAAMPRTPEPELATLVTKVPAGDAWLFEIKFDGYRILSLVKDGRARLLSRNGKDWTERFSAVADGLRGLAGHDAVLDGEVVVLQENGVTDFQALQNHIKRGKSDDLVYYAFDLLHLDGHDLTGLPLTSRKEALRALIDALGKQDRIRYSDHVEGHGEAVLANACGLGLEGVIAKRGDAPYRAGRGKDWLKLKCIENQEFVIGGWTEPAGSRKGLGALLLGVYDGKELKYAGRVGTGFTDSTLGDIAKKLAKLEVAKSPFSTKPPGTAVHWVKPTLVAQVEFTEWTSDGHLRHPSFQGLREDKAAGKVVRESKAAPVAEPSRNGSPPPRVSSKRLKKGDAEVGGVRISHPDRVIYPKLGITKKQLAEYYLSVADRMLPHVAGRPIMMLRCQQGVGGPMFFQKNAGVSVPPGIAPVTIPDEKRGGPPSTYLRIESAQGIVELVQLGVVEIHVWGSVEKHLETPDRIVFDLDPDPTVPWSRVVKAAVTVREELTRIGLKSFLKTTGGKGLHVVAPLDPVEPWDIIKEATRQIAMNVVEDDPKGFTVQLAKAKRTGKIFIDYLRNGRGATWIAPYAARAREGAGVSMPIAWSALATVDPAKLNVSTLTDAKFGADPWREIDRIKQRLPRAKR
jgi:bifunctional non-homologous end joining protein LigD